MATLKVDITKVGETAPSTRIAVPLAVARLALKLMPAKAGPLLEQHGILVADWAARLAKEGVRGRIAEIRRSAETVIVSIE